MSVSVNKTDNGIVKRMAFAGVTTGTLVGLHKAGKLNTQAADEFISQMGKAVKNRDKATLKAGWEKIVKGTKDIGSKIYNTGKEFFAKDGATKKEILTNKAKSLWDGLKGIKDKAVTAGKDFWAKDAAGKKEVAEKILKNPATKWAAGITAAFVALGLIFKGIKNHREKAQA